MYYKVMGCVFMANEICHTVALKLESKTWEYENWEVAEKKSSQWNMMKSVIMIHAYTLYSLWKGTFKWDFTSSFSSVSRRVDGLRCNIISLSFTININFLMKWKVKALVFFSKSSSVLFFTLELRLGVLLL